MANKRYSFEAIIRGQKHFPKGFYYQKDFVILVGCEKKGHTIRTREKISDVKITITEITMK